jgi:hypothetical protein
MMAFHRGAYYAYRHDGMQGTATYGGVEKAVEELSIRWPGKATRCHLIQEPLHARMSEYEKSCCPASHDSGEALRRMILHCSLSALSDRKSCDSFTFTA